MKNFYKKCIASVGVTLGGILFVATAFAWTAPTQVPPAGNVAAPVHTGAADQIKIGGLKSNAFLAAPSGIFRKDCPAGQLCVLNIFEAINTAITGTPGLSVDAYGRTLIKGQLTIADGNQAAGKVLTSDAGGKATWQVPGATPAGATLPAGTLDQTLRHNGTTWVASDLLKSNGTTQVTVAEDFISKRGFFQKLTAYVGRFGCSLSGAGACSTATLNSSSFFEAGLYNTGNLTWGIRTDGNGTVTIGSHPQNGVLNKGLAIGPQGDTIHRGKIIVDASLGGAGSAGKDVLELRGSMQNTEVTIVSDKPTVTFWNKTGNTHANISAKKGTFQDTIQVVGGSPAPGKVLTAVDTAGNATWSSAGTTQTYSGTGGSLVYTKRSPTTKANFAQVFCENNDIAIGGGGQCQMGIASSLPIGSALSGSPSNFNSSQNGWRVSCLYGTTAGGGTVGANSGGNNGDVNAEVVCMRANLFTTVIQ